VERKAACSSRACGKNSGAVAVSLTPKQPSMEATLLIARALADENRVRILMFLGDGELCVCQIIEMLNLAPSTVSEHMALLQRAGLVAPRKDGRWIFYRLASGRRSKSAAAALRWVRESIKGDPVVRKDTARLRSVRRTPVEDLCRCYKT